MGGHRTWVHLPAKGGRVALLLHGGMSSSASLLHSIGPRLSANFRVCAFDRRGHGRTADTDEEFSYELMADETIRFLEHIGRRAHLIGHSDGGNVALLVALRRPDLVRRIVVIGANYHYNGLVAPAEISYDGPGFIEWALRYGTLSPNGVAHARTMAEKTERMLQSGPTLTPEDLAGISVPVLVMSGDDDVVTLEHTVSMYRSIPEAQLSVVPGTSHALLKERTKECARIITTFLMSALPVETYAPVRRRTDSPAEPNR